jgi:methyl coenzyme M reductase beta subunit
MLLAINTQGEEGKDGGGVNPVMKRHLELEIKTLQNAPRDADKLERLLTVKERQKEEAMHMEDTQKLVTEIEMLRIVLYLVNMNRNITPQRQDRKMRRNS